MANIYDVANELSRTLRDLPEYKAVVESKQAIEANPEAKTLFDEYVAFQNQLQGLMQSGQLPLWYFRSPLEENKLKKCLETFVFCSKFLIKN